MKKMLVCSVLLLALAACKEESPKPEAETKKKVELTLEYKAPLQPILFEYTSTGCFGCGSWAKPAFSDLVSEFGSSITPLAVHIKYDDPMITKTSEEIAANRHGQPNTPELWVNDEYGVQFVNGSISVQESINKLRTLITNSQAGLLCMIDGKRNQDTYAKTRVKVGVHAKALDQTKEYYLACYLLKNGIVHHQTGYRSNPAIHNHVILQSASDTWGKRVLFNHATFEYEHTFDSDFSEDHHIVSILWMKENNRYVPLGGYNFR